MNFKKLGFALAGMLMYGAASHANAALVDLELSLVIDVSGSVSTGEYTLQMDGYANAFRDTSVQQNIAASTNGIAVNVVFFASSYYSTALDAFTILTSAAQANAYADLLDNFSRPGGGGTAIYAGINRAVDLLLNNGLDATVGTVIDVSGDGASTSSTTAASRDAAVAQGFTINGLPIGSTSLATFYNDYVIGGPGAFVQPASSFTDFETAVINKISAETSVVTPPSTASAPGALSLLLVSGAFMFLRLRKRK